MDINITLDSKSIVEVLTDYRTRAEVAENKLKIIFQRLEYEDKLKSNIEMLLKGADNEIKYQIASNPIVLTLKQ